MAKTALMELIELLETYMVVNDEIPDYYDGLKKGKDLAKSLLDLEKKQIVEAWTDAFERSGEGWNGEYGVDGITIDKLADTYYTQIYNPIQ